MLALSKGGSPVVLLRREQNESGDASEIPHPEENDAPRGLNSVMFYEIHVCAVKKNFQGSITILRLDHVADRDRANDLNC